MTGTLCYLSAALWGVMLLTAVGRALDAAEGSTGTSQPPSSRRAAPLPLRDVLEPIRAKHDLPALAAAVVMNGRVVALDAVGLRKAGSDAKVTRDDQFHLGSCTKAMTATVIGLLVEQGKLKWDTPLAEALPDLAGEMHADFRKVTVRQLLRHRAGLRPNLPKGKTWRDVLEGGRSVRDQRTRFARAHLSAAPAYEPGTKYQYSNAGYGILGAVVERATGKQYEAVMRAMLFEPLGMTSAGFGAMGTPGKIDQPWQHRVDAKGRRRAIAPGPHSDNPDVIGPGGKVHCSMADWAKFVTEHLPSSPRRPRLLRAETRKTLHTPPPGGHYAMGWLVTQRKWGGGRVLTHAGCNTMNFAVTWLAPRRDFAVLVATNQGGGGADKATDTAAAALIRRFLSSK